MSAVSARRSREAIGCSLRSGLMEPRLQPLAARPNGTTRRDALLGDEHAQHLRDARASSEADEALARVRQPRAREEHAAGARPRAPHPAHRLELPRAVRVGAARRDRARIGHHRRRDRAHRRRARRRGLGRRSTRCCSARPTSCTTTQTLSRRDVRARSPSATTNQQLLDLVFTVGQYHLVSMALNTFRVRARRRRHGRSDSRLASKRARAFHLRRRARAHVPRARGPT